MRTHTNDFKTNIKTIGRQVDTKIIYSLNNEEIELGNEELNSIVFSFQGDILKSVMKQLEIDSKEEIPLGTILECQIGIKVGNSYEYLNYGNFVVDKVEKQEDTYSWIITCYDKMLYSMKDYEELQITYPITIRNYITALCTELNLIFANSSDEFCNYDKEIQNDLFISQDGTSLGYTYRDIFDQLAEVTGSVIYINNNDEVELKYLKLEDTGANLLDGEEGYTRAYFEEDGTYKSTGTTARRNCLFNYILEVNEGETYCFSLNENVYNIIAIGTNDDDGWDWQQVTNTNKIVYQVPEGIKYLQFSFNYNNTTSITDAIVEDAKAMIQEGSNRIEPYREYGETTELDTIDEHFLKDVNVKFGEKFGPVNSIVLSRSAESDNIYLRDEDSIALNGLTELKIIDNQFMNFNDRDQYLPDLLEALDGLEFYRNDYSSTGILYYELGDFYNVSVDETTYKCLMLNDDIEIKRGIVENIFTDLPRKTETDYKKSDKTDNRINQAYIIVNKQNQTIDALTRKVNDLDGYTKEEIDELILNVEGVTNKLINSGGNNIFRNTGLWFEDTSNIEYLYPSNTLYPSDELYMLAEPYFEYWQGKVVRMAEDKAANLNALLLQNTTLSQKQQVRNGSYTISFKYKKPIQLSTASVTINGETIELTENEGEFVKTIDVTSQYINISFLCDTDNGVEIYDLMGNVGEEKAEYSQHQNETTTDTVNISKGITITSSDTNTTFKANSDGIRVYNSRDLETPMTKFTDTGTDTKKIIVENEATIVEVLFKKVGNNTWLTKL